ncbi:MAG: hypothetical protein AAF206_02720 [Bacteroidota bacterium]
MGAIFRTFGFLWISFLWFACASDHGPAQSSSSLTSPPLPQNWEEGYKIRLEKGDSLLADPKALLKCLPQQLSAFNPPQTETQSFSGQGHGFVECTQVFQMPDGHYLSIQMADYAQDSSGFAFLYQQWQVAATPFTLPPEHPLHFAIGWQQRDQETGVHSLHLGLLFRFHVFLRTDLPEHERIFSEALHAFDSKQLQALSRLYK